MELMPGVFNKTITTLQSAGNQAPRISSRVVLPACASAENACTESKGHSAGYVFSVACSLCGVAAVAAAANVYWMVLHVAVVSMVIVRVSRTSSSTCCEEAVNGSMMVLWDRIEETHCHRWWRVAVRFYGGRGVGRAVAKALPELSDDGCEAWCPEPWM